MDCCANFGDAAWVCAQVWLDEGKAIKWISRQLNSTPSTVRYNVVRPMPSERQARRPPAMSPLYLRDMQKRKKLVKKLCLQMIPGPHSQRRKYPNAQAIAREINLHSKLSFVVSACMVRRDLASLGFKSLRRQLGPKRMDGDTAKCVAACRVFLQKAKAWMKRLTFTDEKYFDSNDHGAEREWCLPGMQPSRIVRDTWAPRVHVWGVIGHGLKFLVRIPTGRMTADQYCLIPFMSYLAKNKLDIVLQYDGDRSHGTPAILRYLSSKNVEILHCWPARSPDLSPIENMWAIIQKRVDSHGPSDAEELWRFVKAEWEAVSMDTVNNLVGSFRSRCERCVAEGGQTIKTKR